jgi:hypothetical protein
LKHPKNPKKEEDLGNPSKVNNSCKTVADSVKQSQGKVLLAIAGYCWLLLLLLQRL